MSKQVGTEWVEATTGEPGERPAYAPAAGQSVNALAQTLGLRVLGRRESGDVVAVIVDGGLKFRCVKP